MVEGNGLENRRAGNGTVGSNPTLSAKQKVHTIVDFFYFVEDLQILRGNYIQTKY